MGPDQPFSAGTGCCGRGGGHDNHAVLARVRLPVGELLWACDKTNGENSFVKHSDNDRHWCVTFLVVCSEFTHWKSYELSALSSLKLSRISALFSGLARAAVTRQRASSCGRTGRLSEELRAGGVMSAPPTRPHPHPPTHHQGLHGNMYEEGEWFEISGAEL